MKKFMVTVFLISIMVSGFVLISLGSFGAATPSETPKPSHSPNPNKPTPEPTSALPDQPGNGNGNDNGGNGNGNNVNNGNSNNGIANGNGVGNANSNGNNGNGNNGNGNSGANGNSDNVGNSDNANNGNGNNGNGNVNNGNNGNGNNGNGNGNNGNDDNNGNNGNNGNGNTNGNGNGNSGTNSNSSSDNNGNGNGNGNGVNPTPTPTPTPTFMPNQNPSKFKISGYILDSNGRGIASAMIIFNVPDIVPAVYSDYSGYYVMYAPAGTYHVNVWPPFDSNVIRYDESAFAVGSDTTKNITLILGYKISGYLTDLAGNSVSKAIVSLDNNLISGWFSTSSGYYFVSAPAGTYKLRVGPSTKYIGDFPRYSENNFVIKGNIFKNITLGTPSPTPSPTSSSTVSVRFDTRYDGQASFTNEKTHTSPQSVKLVLPTNAQQGSSATALYAYSGTLNSLSTFSIYASYNNATPRFVIYLDTTNDGLADTVLLSDYQFVSNGQWTLTTGGLRWGWTETNPSLTSYETTWKSLDSWKGQYGNAKVLFVGIALEYWAVADNYGLGQPLYADELMLNGVLTGLTYTIVPLR